MSHGKQFTLYTNVFGPNGWYAPRPICSLEELTKTTFAGCGRQESRYRS